MHSIAAPVESNETVDPVGFRANQPPALASAGNTLGLPHILRQAEFFFFEIQFQYSN